MTTAKTVILEHVCPALGVVFANMMFSAPAKDARRAVLRGSLGDLNPTPWAVMTGNCVGWVTYALLTRNFYVYFANAPGFLLSVWLNLCATKLQYQGHVSNEMRQSFVKLLQENQQQHSVESGAAEESQLRQNGAGESTIVQRAVDVGKLVLQVTSQQTPAPAPHERLLVGIVLVWTAIISLISFGSSFSQSVRELIVGLAVNFNLLFFYGAPLSTIWIVLKNKNSASIHLPTMLTNTANAVFWTAYALAIQDPFIYVPNGIGVLLGVVQIVLYIFLPRIPFEQETEESPLRSNDEEQEQVCLSDDLSPRQVEEAINGETIEMHQEASVEVDVAPTKQIDLKV